jgi:hypothetical protein
MKIATDIDEVIVKTTENVLNIYNQERNLSFSYENIPNYPLPHVLGLGEDEALEAWKKILKIKKLP